MSLRDWGGSRSSDDGDSLVVHLKDLDMRHVTFTAPDLASFTGIDTLGLIVTGSLNTSRPSSTPSTVAVFSARAYLGECPLVDALLSLSDARQVSHGRPNVSRWWVGVDPSRETLAAHTDTGLGCRQ